MIGEIIGPYRIVAALGSGGMGVVWKAIDTRLNRPVAIKAIRDTDAENTEAVLRLRAEALAAASLDHPYICKIYELLETATATLVVMEFVAGETLEEILMRQRPALADTLLHGSEIAEGLANAHARGIVHRDVKPANVMVTPHNHIKLLDFGIARVTRDDVETRLGLTRPGSSHGTPQYMAPEQALGQPIDGRTDLFALGVLLFRSLTGKLPFDGATRDAYVQQMLSGPMHPLDTLAPSAPQHVRDVVKACLEREPARRPASATIVADTLRRSADALSTGLHPIAQQPSRGLPRWVMPLALLLIAAAVMIMALRQWIGAPGEDDGPRALVPAVTWQSAESHAHISPDGRWLSFISDRDNESRIFVQPLEGGDAVPLTVPGTPVGHVWSPEGREIAVLVGHANRYSLIVVPAFFGGSPRTSTALEEAQFGSNVLRWTRDGIYISENRGQRGFSLIHVSPDSGRVNDISARWPNPIKYTGIDVEPGTGSLVLDATVGGRRALWTLNLDGSNLQRLTEDAFVNRRPLWVSAGLVAFESNRGGQMDLWQVSTSTKRATQLTSSMMAEVPTGASSDGTIAFEERATTVNLWRLGLAAGETRQLTSDALSDYWPSVSGGGTRLTFQRTRPTPAEGFQFLDARVHVAESPDSAPLKSRAIADGFGARVSPDGNWVAYYQRLPDVTRLRLLVANLTTGEQKTLSDDCFLPDVALGPPVEWSGQNLTWGKGPDLYFVTLSDQRTELRRADMNRPGGSSVIAVSPSGAGIRDLRVSPDGAMIGYKVRLPRTSGGSASAEIRVLQIPGNQETVLREPSPSSEVHLLGWSRNGLILMRTGGAALGELQLAELSLTGSRRTIATVADSFSATARVDQQRGRLYVTRAIDGVHNIHVVTLADGSVRALTSNQSPGVSFSGILPLESDAIIFAREERKADIWLVRRK